MATNRFASLLSDDDDNTNNNNSTSSTAMLPLPSDIEIEDIIVMYDGIRDNTYGEFHYKNIYSINRQQRIIDLIEVLAIIANTYHQKNFDADGKIIPGHENKLTRLIMHEFSFYTNDSPLSEIEFSEIQKAANLIASKLSPNLILIFSSFPVEQANKKLANRIICLQCGAVPKCKISGKTTPSKEDVMYPSFSSKPANLNSKLIKCTTLGGKAFLMPISICLELSHCVAHLTVTRKLINHISKNKSKLFPTKLSHVVTSNTVDIEDMYLSPIITRRTIAQADPCPDNAYVLQKKNNLPKTKINLSMKVFSEQLKNIRSKYPQLSILKKSNTLILVNPPFGSKMKIAFYTEHNPGELPANLKDIVQQYAEQREVTGTVTSLLEELYKLQFEYCHLLFSEAIEDKFDTILLGLISNPKFINHIEPLKGYSALHYFIKQNDCINSRRLLEQGTAPNLCHPILKLTPGHLAAQQGNTQALQLLIEYRADFSLKNDAGKTALIYAIEKKHWKAVTLILMHRSSLFQDEQKMLNKSADAYDLIKDEFVELLKDSSREKMVCYLHAYKQGKVAICEIIGIEKPDLLCGVGFGLGLFDNSRNNFIATLNEIWLQDEAFTNQPSSSNNNNG